MSLRLRSEVVTVCYDSNRSENLKTPSLVQRNNPNSSVAKRKRELGDSPLKRIRTQQSATDAGRVCVEAVDALYGVDK